VANPFRQRFGAPAPPTPTGIRFRDRTNQRIWEKTLRDVGSGWFMDRFLYLFGAGLSGLEACVEAWSFLVPPREDRVILGRNAYGSLLVLEEPEEAQRVYVLDPIRVVYWTDPNLDLLGLIGRWLPKDLVPHFLDDELYRSLVRGGAWLPDDAILAPITPIGLGGEVVSSNFQEEQIVDYYRTTAPIYAKAFARGGKKAPRKAPRKGRR